MTKETIPYAQVDCTGNEKKYISEVLKSGWLTTASKAHELESRIMEMVGAKHVIAVNSCTSALHLALEAVGVSRRDKVLIPTWTFTATAEVVRYLGADPILLDVDYGSASLTPEIVQEAIDTHSNIKAIVVVHFGGQAAQMLSTEKYKGIYQICHENGIKVIEDAAHAFPSKDRDLFIGNIGDITCFSFYANKTMTTGEGGMLLTNDDDIAKRVKLMRLHGIDRDAWDRYTSNKPSWEYDILAPGFKYNMPDINAAVGLAQLERLEEFRAKRQQWGEFYIQQLSELNSIDLPTIRVPHKDHAWHIFPIIVNQYSKLDRDSLMKKLAEDGIGTSVHYKPLHRMTYYKKKYKLDLHNYPSAEKLWAGCVSLPIYSLLSQSNIEYIVSRLKFHIDGK